MSSGRLVSQESGNDELHSAVELPTFRGRIVVDWLSFTLSNNGDSAWVNSRPSPIVQDGLYSFLGQGQVVEVIPLGVGMPGHGDCHLRILAQQHDPQIEQGCEPGVNLCATRPEEDKILHIERCTGIGVKGDGGVDEVLIDDIVRSHNRGCSFEDGITDLGVWNAASQIDHAASKDRPANRLVTIDGRVDTLGVTSSTVLRFGRCCVIDEGELCGRKRTRYQGT